MFHRYLISVVSSLPLIVFSHCKCFIKVFGYLSCSKYLCSSNDLGVGVGGKDTEML